jgi:hypothetical protein
MVSLAGAAIADPAIVTVVIQVRSRRDIPLPWSSSAHPDYVAFKGLQTLVAELLTRSSGARPAATDAARNFARVTSNEFEQTWPDVAVDACVYYPDGRDPTDLNRPLRSRAKLGETRRGYGY